MHPTICPPEVLLAVARAGSFRRAADGAHPRQAPVRIRMGEDGTAGIAMWNMGAGYLGGLLLHHATRRGVVRL